MKSRNKAIEKLREKAIHALGGVMPCDAFDKPLGEVKEYTRYPVRLKWNYELPSGANEIEKKYAKERMALKIAEKIVVEGFYELNSAVTPFGTLYEMTVEIIPLKCGDAPRENTMNFQ